jgi:hypothetical protein
VAPGASLRELMTRMGHASPRAALIYQHANREGSGTPRRGVVTSDRSDPGTAMCHRTGTRPRRARTRRVRSAWWARRESNPRHLPCKWHGRVLTRDVETQSVPRGT